jgi:hypothetical protein
VNNLIIVFGTNFAYLVENAVFIMFLPVNTAVTIERKQPKIGLWLLTQIPIVWLSTRVERQSGKCP